MRRGDLSAAETSKRAPSATGQGSGGAGEHAMPTSQSNSPNLHGHDTTPRTEFAATAVRRHELFLRRQHFGHDMGASLDLIINTFTSTILYNTSS